MALHELYKAVPLSLSAPSDAEVDGGCGQSAVSSGRSAEQLHILAHSDKIHRLSSRSSILLPAHASVSGGGGGGSCGGGDGGGGGNGNLDGIGSDRATEAEKVWLAIRKWDFLQTDRQTDRPTDRQTSTHTRSYTHTHTQVRQVIRALDLLSAEAETTNEPERAGARERVGREVEGVGGLEEGEKADMEEEEEDITWGHDARRHLEPVNEGGKEREREEREAAEKDGLQFVRHEGAEDREAGLARPSTPAILRGAWASRAIKEFDEGAIRHLASVVAIDMNCLVEEEASRGACALGNSENRQVHIRFSHSRDNVHKRHVQLLRTCAGPFVIPLLDIVEGEEEEQTRGSAQEVPKSLKEGGGDRLERRRRKAVCNSVRDSGMDVWTRLAREPEEEEEKEGPAIAHVYAGTCELVRESPKLATKLNVQWQRKAMAKLAEAKQKRPISPPKKTYCTIKGKTSGRGRSASPELQPHPLRSAIVVPLHVTTLLDELRRRHALQSDLEPLVTWVGGMLAFLHMKNICLVDWNPANFVALSDGSWRLADLSYARRFGTRLATHDPYLLSHLHHRSLVPEILRAAHDKELDPNAAARTQLLAGAPIDVFNLGLFLHLVVAGREYFKDRQSAHQQLIVNAYPLQMLQEWSAHPVMILLFDSVLIRSAGERLPLGDLISQFSLRMQKFRDDERDRLNAQALLDLGSASIHRALKTALKNMPRDLREGLLKTRGTL